MPAVAALPSGATVLCLPIGEPEGAAIQMARRVAAGLSVWAVDETIRQAVSGFAQDPVCPRILTRAAGEAAAREVLGALGDGTCAVLYADVDRFKAFNDAAGHECGDKVLREVGEALRDRIRSTDLVWRIGDEFCAVLPNADLSAARRIAEDVSRSVAGLRIAGIPVSLTIGLAVRRAADLRTLLGQADARMMRGKGCARGQIYVDAGESEASDE